MKGKSRLATKNCRICQKEFIGPAQCKYCCYECKKNYYNKQQRQRRAEAPEKYRANEAQRREKNRQKYNETKKEWARKNAEKVKESVRQWRENNPEQYKRYNAEWREQNRGRFNEIVGEWRQQNRDKTRDFSRKAAYKKAGITDPDLLEAYVISARLKREIRKCNSETTNNER